MSECLVSYCEWQHDRSWFQAPPMPHRCVEENGSTAMLAAKSSAGVEPEVNLGECVTCTPLPSTKKAAHSGFEIQETSPEVQYRGISGHTKRTYVLQNFFLEKEVTREAERDLIQGRRPAVTPELRLDPRASALDVLPLTQEPVDWVPQDRQVQVPKTGQQ